MKLIFNFYLLILLILSISILTCAKFQTEKTENSVIKKIQPDSTFSLDLIPYYVNYTTLFIGSNTTAGILTSQNITNLKQPFFTKISGIVAQPDVLYILDEVNKMMAALYFSLNFFLFLLFRDCENLIFFSF